MLLYDLVFDFRVVLFLSLSLGFEFLGLFIYNYPFVAFTCLLPGYFLP